MQQEEVILGARALGEQISKIMPTYDIMLNQIEDMRESVKLLGDQKTEKDIGKRVYNNTVGIFGPRGAGKSSALYTLRSNLDIKSSIMFPLIEPDNFGENTKIIGSIVGFLKEEGERLLEALKKRDMKFEERNKLIDKLADYYNAGIYKPNNRLKQLIHDTIEYHLYTESQYRSILTHHYEDLAVYVKNSFHILSPDIAFKKKFNELIDEIIRVKKVLDAPNEPILIFIFIDDIDLQTSKTRELMEALLQYTDHPNIVTVLSGDYDILLESLTLALLADEPLKEIGLSAYDSLRANNRLESRKSLFTIMKRKSELAHEYLKKIIPSARRHQLVNWNTETIPRFSFGQFNLLDRMAQLMGGQSIFNYINKHSKSDQDYYLPIKKSYIVFDERPRGLVHAYYNLIQLLHAIEVKDKDIFMSVKTFIDTLILSNTSLLKHQEWMFKQFMQWGSDQESTYIYYPTVIKNENNNNENIKLQIFILAEIVKKLLPNVRYDTAAYIEFKNELFDGFIKGDKGKVVNVHSYGYKLYHLMRGIVLHVDVSAAMLMLEYLSQSPFNPYFYEYEYSENNNKRDKDKFIVESIALLLGQYPSLFEPLYYKAQNEGNHEINKALNILHDLCNVPSEYEVTERIFEVVLDNFHFQKTIEGISEEEVKRALFINTLTKIRNKIGMENYNSYEDVEGQLYSSFTIISKDSNRNLAKALQTITEKLAVNPTVEFPKSITQTIDSNMGEFSSYISHKLRKSNINVQIDIKGTVKERLRKFEEEESGTRHTKYSECKGILREYMKSSDECVYLRFDIYRLLIEEIEALASNNRVWYGRSEARNLYNALRYHSIIAEPYSDSSWEQKELFFTGNDKFILELYYRYCTSMKEFSDDQEYESAKISIKTKLDHAFSSIRGQTEIELNKFELSLEDVEVQMKNSGEV